jgi:prevent-host-death family protein
MIRRVSSAEAEADLAALINEVADGHSRIIIEREGRAIAALVGIDAAPDIDLPTKRGALALVGAADSLSDVEIAGMVEEIYTRRDADQIRPVVRPE